MQSLKQRTRKQPYWVSLEQDRAFTRESWPDSAQSPVNYNRNLIILQSKNESFIWGGHAEEGTNTGKLFQSVPVLPD